MNCYVIVEGEKAAKKIYREWIHFLNPTLSPVDYINEINVNNYFIFAGKGQPQFWQRVESAIIDVNKNLLFDRLVICVDSENSTFDEKLNEAKALVNRLGCRIDVRYVIQHFCIETWFLGNTQMIRKHPQDQDLIQYKKMHDVKTADPELLPPHTGNGWNRAQFAYYYLKAAIRDIHANRHCYNKHNPDVVEYQGYYYQVKQRFETSQHIKSFRLFIEAFTSAN